MRYELRPMFSFILLMLLPCDATIDDARLEDDMPC